MNFVYFLFFNRAPVLRFDFTSNKVVPFYFNSRNRAPVLSFDFTSNKVVAFYFNSRNSKVDIWLVNLMVE